jgi:acetyl/propionyl-CoA carboxylase alpha subunit
MRTLQKILIANRGEIACRIIRTCHEMGISTVAVYSDADRKAPFVQQADEAVHVGPAPSADSYLCIDKIINAATSCNADAIHPGYGFLAENADFAAAVEKAGIVFIGPSAASIRLLGSKAESKDLVTKAGVPIVPSYDLEDVASMQFPIMLKASAGGGACLQPSPLRSALHRAPLAMTPSSPSAM